MISFLPKRAYFLKTNYIFYHESQDETPSRESVGSRWGISWESIGGTGTRNTRGGICSLWAAVNSRQLSLVNLQRLRDGELDHNSLMTLAPLRHPRTLFNGEPAAYGLLHKFSDRLNSKTLDPRYKHSGTKVHKAFIPWRVNHPPNSPQQDSCCKFTASVSLANSPWLEKPHHHDSYPYRNWDLERVMMTQCAVEPFEGVCQYVEGRLRKCC